MSKSIMQDKDRDRTCYLCRLLEGNYTEYLHREEHHVMDGPNRRHSEHYGIKVYLCPRHHQNSPDAVHNNITNMRILQAAGQRAFEAKYSHEKWMEVFGRNFL